MPPTGKLARILVACLLALALAGAAHSAQVGRDADLRRTGWYPDQPGLLPLAVSGSSFGQRFSTPVTGAVFGQPLVFGGVLFVTTEANWIYGLDPLTGAIQWSRNVGAPWDARDIPGCFDLFPTVGITATPVIDDATGIAYFTSKTYATGSHTALFQMHAVAVSTGTEQPGFPVTIAGAADNDAGQSFSPATQNQRPGLLLLNGVVYAAFGSVCDALPFQGWVIGVSTAGAITTMWVDRGGSGTSGDGIWMAGSGLMSDAPGQILFSTGNGMSGGSPTGPTAGDTPPADLGEAVVRLSVRSDGSLLPVDFFTRSDAAYYDAIDGDIGSGGVVGLPNPPFGTPAFPNLILQVGKPGVVTLLDGSSLGGFEQGPGGRDLVVQEVVPSGGGVWSKPAVWGGDGGWVYVPTASDIGSVVAFSGYLNAYHAGVDIHGRPRLTLAGNSADAFGFSSSAPIVTSNGTTSGSALVWIVWNPDSSGVGAELRAYDALPGVNGRLLQRFSAPVGQGSKFNPPGVFQNHLYVGTRDGHVIGFGLSPDTSGVDAPSPRASLGIARPNPSAGATTMDLALAQGGRATLTIFDLRGRRVRLLVDGDFAAGSQPVIWDGRDDRGAIVPPGLYLARLDAAGTRQTRRVMLVR
jgi:iron transport multicopper oxidase